LAPEHQLTDYRKNQIRSTLFLVLLALLLGCAVRLLIFSL